MAPSSVFTPISQISGYVLTIPLSWLDAVRVRHLPGIRPPRNCNSQPEIETNAERTTVNFKVFNSFIFKHVELF